MNLRSGLRRRRMIARAKKHTMAEMVSATKTHSTAPAGKVSAREGTSVKPEVHVHPLETGPEASLKKARGS